MWLRPYGLPVLIRADPDGAYQGDFYHWLVEHGVEVNYCPAEGHWQIGGVERRNAVLRTITEHLVDQFAVVNAEELDDALLAGVHSLNSSTYTRGRTPYQAVFGRVPRLTGLFDSDSSIIAKPEKEGGPLRAELLRAEAIRHIHDVATDQAIRKAILRKTRRTEIPDISPGDRCAFWRWRKIGGRKCGAWVVARFLSWDPEAPGKNAWVRTSTTTTLVTCEQLRVAVGFEQWSPDEDDVKALKDATKALKDSVWEDERGPAPIENSLEVNVEQPEVEAAMPLAEAAMASQPPAPRLPEAPQALPAQGPSASQPRVQINVDRPSYQHTVVNQRFGPSPNTPRRTRSRTPSRMPVPDPPPALPPILEGQAALGHEVPSSSRPSTPGPTATLPGEAPLPAPPSSSSLATPPATTPALQAGADPGEPHGADDPSTGSLLTPTPSQHNLADDPQDQVQDMSDNLLPAKRPSDILFTMHNNFDGTFERTPYSFDGSPELGYGPKSRMHHQAYINSADRVNDVPDGKDPTESDSTDSEQEEKDQTTSRPLNRQEKKQLDRELPWREIWAMGPRVVDKFLHAVEIEHDAWTHWDSVRPLSKEEVQKVVNDKYLRRRVMRSRACYCDKNRGVGEIKAKCRVVCIGCTDPDIFNISRDAPTPGRLTEHMIFSIIASGMGGKFGNTNHRWKGWLADAKTAFLQGKQPDGERAAPLYMWAPKDPLIGKSGRWSAEMYQILGNVYGLPNAPRLWFQEIQRRLHTAGYCSHSFDRMRFLKCNSQGDIVSIVVIYVDDFIGVYREDYNIDEVTSLFEWGSFEELLEDTRVIFKGKELTIKRQDDHFQVIITQSKFIENLERVKLARGRLQGPEQLSVREKAEFSSVAGCLQWLAGQSRPEVGPAVSLCSRGEATTIQDLKNLADTVEFLHNTKNKGIAIEGIPINRGTTVCNLHG